LHQPRAPIDGVRAPGAPQAIEAHDFDDRRNPLRPARRAVICRQVPTGGISVESMAWWLRVAGVAYLQQFRANKFTAATSNPDVANFAALSSRCHGMSFALSAMQGSNTRFISPRRVR